MSKFDNTHYIALCQPAPPKMLRHQFSMFAFYYAIHNNTFYPIALSKPSSTQKPHYYLNTSPTFPTLQALLNHYTAKPNMPLN